MREESMYYLIRGWTVDYGVNEQLEVVNEKGNVLKVYPDGKVNLNLHGKANKLNIKLLLKFAKTRGEELLLKRRTLYVAPKDSKYWPRHQWIIDNKEERYNGYRKDTERTQQ